MHATRIAQSQALEREAYRTLEATTTRLVGQDIEAVRIDPAKICPLIWLLMTDLPSVK